jgi:hypothetical protein
LSGESVVQCYLDRTQVKLIGQASFAIAVFLAVVGETVAQSSGEFAGVYVTEGKSRPTTPADRELLELKCLLAPNTSHADGQGATYLLDAPYFEVTGKVSYIKAATFQCRYDRAERVERCRSVEYYDGQGWSYRRFNVYEKFVRNLQRGVSLFTPEEIVTWKSKGTFKVENRFALHRCKCLNVEQIESKAHPAVNLLSKEQSDFKLFLWNEDPSAQDYELARKAMNVMGGCRPILS